MHHPARNPVVYADHAASAQPTVFRACDAYGNPSAPHAVGRAARTAADSAWARIARALRFSTAEPARHFVVTSGGTESNNLVLLQPGLWSFIVLLPTEHHAVTLPAQWMANHGRCEIVYLTPDGTGRLDTAELARELAVRPGRTGLVTVAYANNEIGTVQDLAAVGAVVSAANAERAHHRVWLHTDAVQAPGHLSMDLDAPVLSGVDFASVSAHKFHGPPGVGLLFCRTPGVLRPILHGGSQQGGLRPGTENVAGLVALAEALADATDPEKLARRIARYRQLSDVVWEALRPGVVSGLIRPTGPPPREGRRLPNHVSFCVLGAHRSELVSRLERTHGLLVSGGSACSADSGLPSHVLAAIGVPPAFIQGSIRISFGDPNTESEARNVVAAAVRRLIADTAPASSSTTGSRTATSAP